jgi:uncharacterized protein
MRLRTLLLVPILAASSPAAAIPPPPEQMSANCESPTYASDVMVCGDPLPRALDARMRDAWVTLDFAAVVAPDAWVEAQDAWFRRRSLCAFSGRQSGCLEDASLERIAVLQALRLVASRPPRRAAAATCPDTPWGGATVRISARHGGAGGRERRCARSGCGNAASTRQRLDALRCLCCRRAVDPPAADERASDHMHARHRALSGPLPAARADRDRIAARPARTAGQSQEEQSTWPRKATPRRQSSMHALDR